MKKDSMHVVEVEEILMEDENPPSKCAKCSWLSSCQHNTYLFLTTFVTFTLTPLMRRMLIYSLIFLLFLSCYLVFRSEAVMSVTTNLLFKMQDQDLPHSIFIFSLCFFFVSLPFTWGYIVFNLAAGYFHGFVVGVLVTATTVAIATSLNHVICKRLFSNCLLDLIRRRYEDEAKLQALLKVLDGPSGIKIISLLRLTPIPFGLQNGLIAMSNIPVRHFMMASAIGLLPTQLINCYISSNFRSIQQITSSSEEGSMEGGYLVVVAQIIAGLLLTKFVVKKAKRQLDEALEEGKDETCQDQMELLREKRNPIEENSIPIIVVQP